MGCRQKISGDLKKQKLERKEKEIGANDKVRFFINSRSIIWWETHYSFVAVSILESLEGILMAELSIELGLVANEVASLYLFSY